MPLLICLNDILIFIDKDIKQMEQDKTRVVVWLKAHTACSAVHWEARSSNFFFLYNIYLKELWISGLIIFGLR